MPRRPRFTTFEGHRRVGGGSLTDAAMAARDATVHGPKGPVLIFDDRSGRVIDVDFRGTHGEIDLRLRSHPANTPEPPPSQAGAQETEPRGRGRPKLGVVAREVTLLPRHWEWLAAQPGGASVALRRLVDAARREPPDDRARAAQEAAYRFVHAVGGDLPAFDEVARALFAGDRARFAELTADWPADVRHYAMALGSA